MALFADYSKQLIATNQKILACANGADVALVQTYIELSESYPEIIFCIINKTNFRKFIDGLKTFIPVLSTYYKYNTSNKTNCFYSKLSVWEIYFYVGQHKIMVYAEETYHECYCKIFFNKNQSLKSRDFLINILDYLKNYSQDAYDKKKRKKRVMPKVYILQNVSKKTAMGLVYSEKFMPLSLKKFDVNLQTNYTDDLLIKNDLIIEELDVQKKSGIVIFHGEPGTGKSYYLRYLMSKLKRKILYIPSSMVSSITTPSFVTMLKKHKNSILLIEDADNVLRKRDDFSDIQSISTLLNISDGILSDVMNLAVIATFNTNLSNIDEAFLRKGRLICQHEFIKLPVGKAQALSDKLGFDTKITESQSLAFIYNQNKENFANNNKPKQAGYKFTKNN